MCKGVNRLPFPWVKVIVDNGHLLSQRPKHLLNSYYTWELLGVLGVTETGAGVGAGVGALVGA